MAAAADENTYNYEGLDQKDVKKAQKELNENPQQVRAHIASLRRWAGSMPHLTCRTDDRFLLRFLRASKFDQSRAQQMLDNFCTVRSSPRGSPEWFVPFELDSPILNDFMQMNFNLNLGFNDDGEAVIMSAMAGLDPDKQPLDDLMRAMYMLGDSVFCDERLVIHGFRMVSNMEGASRKSMSMWQNPKTMFKMMRNWQDAFPVRTKAIIYFNEPSFFDVMLKLFLPMMKEKLRKRIHRCGSDVEKLKKAMGPGAERLLPKDMGGVGKSYAEMREERIARFKSAEAAAERQKLAAIKVDESKRQPSTKDYLKSFDDACDPNMGIAGTFTKLDVS